jgi:4-amino-4-deoxychorismate lyase
MFWYNGKLIEGNNFQLQVNDPGLLFGATVFTTLRVYDRSLTHPLTNWKAHCDRLMESLETFGWELPKWERIQQGAEILLSHHPVLRITIFSDGRELIIGRSLPENLEERQQKGGIAYLASSPLYSRHLPGYKTGNYLGAWLALQQAQKLGAHEAILTDEEGNWLESSTGNLWGWKDGCWYTPPLDAGILPGITRSHLLNWLKFQDIRVEEDTWNWELVNSLEAIAYSNCGVEVIPFCQIIHSPGNLTFNPSHPVLEQLRSYFRVKPI